MYLIVYKHGKGNYVDTSDTPYSLPPSRVVTGVDAPYGDACSLGGEAHRWSGPR
jgi:hypothetical protein